MLLRNSIRTFILWCSASVFSAGAVAEQAETYQLKPLLSAGCTSDVTIRLEVGGDMLVRSDGKIERLPLTVTGKLSYQEELIVWSADSDSVARSLRSYETASAMIQVDKGGDQRTLPADSRLVVAEIREGRSALNGADRALSREQLDLINVVGNTLAIDRLLPDRSLAEGDRWSHDAATIGALLGMDHVAVCEVTSVLTGESHRQVQIRMAGTVHGTIDGASTEIQLRGAYLFHLGQQRITKLNLAIQEKRSASEVVPGLDVVAKVSLVVVPVATPKITPEQVRRAGNVSQSLMRTLRFDAEERGFRFEHDAAWYVTAESNDLLSLKCLQNSDVTAHCNVTTLPPRSNGRQTSLPQFESDVRESLGEKLGKVIAATEWTTKQEHHCLGVIVDGKVAEVPLQWRYYLVWDDNLPRVSVAVTVEQSLLKQFADADRQIVDTMQLSPLPSMATAAKESGPTAR